MSQKYYEDGEYKKRSLTGDGENFFARKMHKLIERPHRENSFFACVLEIGADQGQHLKYVTHKFHSYITIDLHLPRNKSADSRVTHLQGDVHKLPFENDYFDRVVVTCVLHHLQDPNKALDELIRVLKDNGVISLLIPRDPSLVYNLVRDLVVFSKSRSLASLKESRQRHKQEHLWNFKDLLGILNNRNTVFIQNESRYPKGLLYVIKSIELKKKI